MNPLPSLSKTLKASFISSSLFVSRIFRAIIRNSGKSIDPFPSASTSLIMSLNSASVGFCPSDRITVPSLTVFIVSSPSWRIELPIPLVMIWTDSPLSKSENASLNSDQKRIAWVTNNINGASTQHATAYQIFALGAQRLLWTVVQTRIHGLAIVLAWNLHDQNAFKRIGSV